MGVYAFGSAADLGNIFVMILIEIGVEKFWKLGGWICLWRNGMDLLDLCFSMVILGTPPDIRLRARQLL